MKKTRIALILATLTALSPLAHASVSSGAHQFKSDVKTAGRNTGHAVRDGAHAVGHGFKSAGHAVADATRHGYHATRKFVTGHA
ncbi:hypothetical protein BTH42_15745 [Burkholderia sp. SRS-W-2-2016]|uniref:hypothetical protein n=1 Tax=Burkholderia sp. SRS-W-2-2016 TaxID=1926878 RepID=UPI00094B6312|nr:hypothetical protein [Burkholderia sp. SRS-W-2-2016]OLL30704.1 hypothetical protein BTH42_15745 [Burkholderia sp. SRS-W-2-2016]